MVGGLDLIFFFFLIPRALGRGLPIRRGFVPWDGGHFPSLPWVCFFIVFSYVEVPVGTFFYVEFQLSSLTSPPVTKSLCSQYVSFLPCRLVIFFCAYFHSLFSFLLNFLVRKGPIPSFVPHFSSKWVNGSRTLLSLFWFSWTSDSCGWLVFFLVGVDGRFVGSRPFLFSFPLLCLESFFLFVSEAPPFHFFWISDKVPPLSVSRPYKTSGFVLCLGCFPLCFHFEFQLFRLPLCCSGFGRALSKVDFLGWFPSQLSVLFLVLTVLFFV